MSEPEENLTSANSNKPVYDIREDGSLFRIFENGVCIDVEMDEKKAYQKLFRLKQGCGFEGNTPIFFQKNA